MAKDQCVEEFLAQLPALAERHHDALQDYDKLVRLNWGSHTSFIRLDHGKVTIMNSCEEYPSCIIRTDEKMARKLVKKKITPMEALLFGNVRVDGDVMFLLSLCGRL